METNARTYTAFCGNQNIVTGDLPTVLAALKAREGQPQTNLTLLFDDQTGRQADYNLRGTLQEVLARAEAAAALVAPASAKAGQAGPGRPKLGVVAREVTLLPRHWEWLEAQQGGASATLRRLIDEARKRDPQGEQLRAAQAATDRFLGVMAGDLPGYEEATRALYQRNQAAFSAQMQDWPADIRDHAIKLSGPCFLPEPLPEPANG